MWENLKRVCGSECEAGDFVVGVCLWSKLERFCGTECEAGGFVVGVGQFGVVWEVSVLQAALWWVCA